MRTFLMSLTAAALLITAADPADAGPFHQIRQNKANIHANSADIDRLYDAFKDGYEEVDSRLRSQADTDQAHANAIQDVRTRAKRWAAASAALTVPHIEEGDRYAVSAIGSGVSGEGAIGINFAAKLPNQITAFVGVASASSERVGRLGVNFSF